MNDGAALSWGDNARSLGIAAYRRGIMFADCPYPDTPYDQSWYAYCWRAGHRQDMRSIEELRRDWEAGQ